LKVGRVLLASMMYIASLRRLASLLLRRRVSSKYIESDIVVQG